jgi:cysteinyl-tRNA synthetase
MCVLISALRQLFSRDRRTPGFVRPFLLVLIALLLAACDRQDNRQDEATEIEPGQPSTAPTTERKPLTQADWLAADDFLYQLQRSSAKRIGETAFDLVVSSISIAGSSPDVVPALKTSNGGKKLILAYMSIGQAEDYRFYWQPDWPANAPAWLDEGDQVWAGDYWVKYWDLDWQAIIYGSPDSYLDQIMALGFDGVYLDRVDAYQFYEERDDRETAAREMVDFIMNFTEYAREQQPGFGVFPQNAEELGIMFPEYLNVVTGIGIEDLYYGYPRDHEPSPADWTAEREAILDQWVDAGKLVLTTDYSSRSEQIVDVYQRARARGYVPYVADRSLGRLRINSGFEPD